MINITKDNVIDVYDAKVNSYMVKIYVNDMLVELNVNYNDGEIIIKNNFNGKICLKQKETEENFIDLYNRFKKYSVFKGSIQ